VRGVGKVTFHGMENRPRKKKNIVGTGGVRDGGNLTKSCPGKNDHARGGEGNKKGSRKIREIERLSRKIHEMK